MEVPVLNSGEEVHIKSTFPKLLNKQVLLIGSILLCSAKFCSHFQGYKSSPMPGAAPELFGIYLPGRRNIFTPKRWHFREIFGKQVGHWRGLSGSAQSLSFHIMRSQQKDSQISLTFPLFHLQQSLYKTILKTRGISLQLIKKRTMCIKYPLLIWLVSLLNIFKY